MKKQRKKSGVEPCWIDRLVLTCGRPWVFVLAFAFLLTPSHLLIAAVNAGAAFLKIDTGARPTAMGGAYTALADDVNALYYNPGGLAHLKRREVGATHAQWLGNTTFDFLGYAMPTKYGSFGLGVTRLGLGDIKNRDANRNVSGSFQASDTAYTLGYSRSVARWTGLGANLKYLQSRIGQYSASAVAFDLGVHQRIPGRPLSLGFSVLNLGNGMKFLDQRDPLPLSIGVGASYRIAGAMQLTMDVRREVYDRETNFSIGSEYALLPTLAVRAGYISTLAQQTGSSSGGLDALGGLGGGLGLKLGRYRFDYTFTPYGNLGNAQRLSLGAKF